MFIKEKTMNLSRMACPHCGEDEDTLHEIFDCRVEAIRDVEFKDGRIRAVDLAFPGDAEAILGTNSISCYDCGERLGVSAEEVSRHELPPQDALNALYEERNPLEPPDSE